MQFLRDCSPGVVPGIFQGGGFESSDEGAKVRLVGLL